MITRYDVMAYGAILAAFCALAAGFSVDVGYQNTGVALALIAAVSVISMFIAYLNGGNSSNDTFTGRGG